MKPFDLEAAKRGDPVVTREGSPVRMVCFNVKDRRSVLGLISFQDGEAAVNFLECGECPFAPGFDLFMAPKKVTKWMNVYAFDNETGYSSGGIYDSRENAERSKDNQTQKYRATVKVEWDE
jgi:hypothetical protein